MAPSVDPDLAKRLAEHYAPECRFDSREEFFPCGLDWMADASSVRLKTWWNEKPERGEAKQSKDKKHWILDEEVIPHGQNTDPKKACDPENKLIEGSVRHQYRMEPIQAKWEGQSEKEMENGDVPCYFSVVPAPNSIFDDNLDRCINNTCDDIYEITYYMVYAYNGNIFAPFNLCKPIEVGTHTGDLEQVVLYAKDPSALKEGDNGLVSCFHFRHAGEGRFCAEPNLSEGAHHVVYPAAFSHASYNRPSWTCRIFGWANDLHNGKGRKWQTWKNLVAVDKDNQQPEWIAYTGRFGGVEGLATRNNLGRPGFGTSNCRLPAFLPVKKIRAKPASAFKQIPKVLAEAVNHQPPEAPAATS